MMIIITILLLFNAVINVECFSSLKEINNYATAHQEFPTPTSLDWINPQYTLFYKNNKPSLFKNMINFLTLRTSPWSLTDLKQHIQTYLSRFNENQIKKISLARIDTSTNPTLYVWGDLNGSFHSLARALNFLEKENIINNELKIIKPNHFFIFNGNVPCGSAYGLETLTLVTSLLIKNPDHIIYLQGQQEYNNYWKNFDVKNQLMLYQGSSKKFDTNVLSDFFSSLPVALYCTNAKEFQNSSLRISAFDQATSWIDEAHMGTFFTDPQRTPIMHYWLYQKEKSNRQPFVKAEIRAYDWQSDKPISNGIGIMDQDKGATTWSLLSCPTTAYQTFNNFYCDAFVKIICDPIFEKSTISLCNRDIRENKDFIYQPPYSLSRAIPEKNGLHDINTQDIFVGTTISLIQGVPIMGKRTLHGMMAKINKENIFDKTENQFIRIIAENDDYNPSMARENIYDFLKKDINTILLPVGSPTLSAYLDVIRKKEALVLFPISGGTDFRNPSLENIIHFRMSYSDEVVALLNYAYTEWNARKFALFYQDDSYGQGPKNTANKILTEKNCTIIDVPYARAATNMKEQAQKINASQPDVIAFFSTAQTTIELIREIGIENIVNKKLMAISFCAEESFRNFSNRHNIPVLIGAVVPNPFISTLEIVREYREAMDRAGYNYDVFSLEAYIGTSILIEVLKKIDAPYSKEKIYTELTKIKDMSLKGITLSYNSATHTLYDTVYLETGNNNEWIAKK